MPSTSAVKVNVPPVAAFIATGLTRTPVSISMGGTMITRHPAVESVIKKKIAPHKKSTLVFVFL
jgi:hypothetical protein